MSTNAAIRFAIGVNFLFAGVSGLAAPVPDASAYAQDSNGSSLRSADGLCWRTGYWTPDDAVSGCDGGLQPPIGKPTAPDLLAMSHDNSVPVSALAVPAIKRCDFSMTVDSDSHFRFGEGQFTPLDIKRLIDAFEQKIMTCGTIESIVVGGHTDRLGSSKRNQQLSERRAASVAAIFINTDIASKVDVRGFGDTRPVSKCAQFHQKAALIRCLAPDRRATIDVRGLSK